MSFNSFFSKCHTKKATMTGLSRQSRQTMTSPICMDEYSRTTPYFHYDFVTNGYNLTEMIQQDPLTEISTSPADLSIYHTTMTGIDMTNTTTSLSIPQNGQYLTFPQNNFSYQFDIYVDNKDDIINETRRLHYEHELQYRYVQTDTGFGIKQNYHSESAYHTRTRHYYDVNGSDNLRKGDRLVNKYQCHATHGLPLIERTGKHTITINALHDYINPDGLKKRRTQFIWDDYIQYELNNYDIDANVPYDISDPFFTLTMRGSGSGLSTYMLQAIRFYDKVIPTDEFMIPFVSQDKFTKCYTTLADTFVRVNSTITQTLLKFLNVDGYTYSANTVIDGVLDLHRLDLNPLYFEFEMYVPPLTTTLFHFGNFVTARPTNNIDFSLYTGLFWGAVNRQYCVRIGDYTHIFGNVSDPDNRTKWAVYLTLDSAKFYHDNYLQTTVLKTDHPYFWDYQNPSVAGQGFINRVNSFSSGDTEIGYIMKMGHTNISQSYPSSGLEQSQADITLHYDFKTGSAEELLTNDPNLTMLPFNPATTLGIVPHPDQAGRQVIFLDQQENEGGYYLQSYSKGLGIPNGIISQMPTANFSIQVRSYLINPPNTLNDDLYDTRIQILNWRQNILSGATTSLGTSWSYLYINGKHNDIYHQIKIDNTLKSDNPDNTESFDTHTTGYKCLTIVFDTTNGVARSYHNGHLMTTSILEGDFSGGLLDPNVSALIVSTVGGSFYGGEYSRQYVESIKVFNRVLTQPETYY